MYLEGQGCQRGYAMAALLVSVAVMAVLMSVAMPVWRHQAQREKEEELVFRGEQWVRALQLYQRKNGPGVGPPSLDVLVQGRYVRKKWKDPITGEDFVPLYPGQQPQQPGRGGQRGGQPGRGGVPSPPPQGGPQAMGGGIMGVYSKSTENSIRQYKGATRYDQWQFIAQNIGGPGMQGPGRGTPGGPGRGTPGMGGPGRGGRGDGGRGRGGGPGRGIGGPPGGPGRGGAGLNNPRRGG
jgi:type II secretory pathway pseudopilin PulG